MDKFRDIKSAQYSIHKISFMGESLDKKQLGTWFDPNTVALVLIKLRKFALVMTWNIFLFGKYLEINMRRDSVEYISKITNSILVLKQHAYT